MILASLMVSRRQPALCTLPVPEGEMAVPRLLWPNRRRRSCVDGSMHRYMKVGIVHFMAYLRVTRGEGPILETLERIAEDDCFSAVEVTWMKDPEVRRQARHLLEVAHMTVAYGGEPRLLTTGLDPNSLDDARRAKAVGTLKGGIKEEGIRRRTNLAPWGSRFGGPVPRERQRGGRLPGARGLGATAVRIREGCEGGRDSASR